jgi:phosphate/sulfate permease
VNGFHDAANSIATVVATRVLSPGVAVAWAAFFNFIAFMVFGTAVAKTIGGDMVNITAIAEDYRFMFCSRGSSARLSGIYNLVSRTSDLKFTRTRWRLCGRRDCRLYWRQRFCRRQ